MTGRDTREDRTVAAVVVHDGADPGAIRYAEWTGAELGVSASIPAEVDPGALIVASTVMVFCGIDRGSGSTGMAFVREEWDALIGSGRRVAVAMVGLAPVTDESRLTLLGEEFTPEQARDLAFFQLRGSVDSEGLGFRQRLALRAAVAQIRARPRRTPDEQAMLDNGGRMDFTSREHLGPLLRWAREKS